MKIIPILTLLLVSAFWGSHAVVGKTIDEQLSPFALTVWRFTFGALLYTPFFPRIFRVFRSSRRTFLHLALTGLFWAVIYPLFFYQSLRFLTPVQSLLLINTSPLIATLFGLLLLHEKISWKQGAGMGLAFIGVAWTTLGQWTANASLTGILLVLIAAMSFAAYTVSSRSISKKLEVLDMVASTSVIGAIELWIITLLSGNTITIWHDLNQLDLKGWSELLYVVVIVSTVAYILYAYGLKRLPASVSSALTFYPQVVFAALIQWIWLGIMPTWSIVISAILIFGGVIFMQLPDRPRTKALHIE